MLEEMKIVLKNFMSLKSAVCEDMNGTVDLSPILCMKGSIGDMHMEVFHGHPAEFMAPVWSSLMKKTDPETVFLVIEVYCGISPESYENGDFEADFNDNPFSEVSRAVAVHGMEIRTGRQFMGLAKFVIGDDGLPVFERPHLSPVVGEALRFVIPSSLERLREATLRGLFDD